MMISVVRVTFLNDPPASFPIPATNNKNDSCPVRCQISPKPDSLEAMLPFDDRIQADSIPHIVLGSPWIDWSYAWPLHSNNLNQDQAKVAPWQLFGVMSADDTILRQAISEDLSKMSLLVHWSPYSDVPVFPISRSELDHLIKVPEEPPAWTGSEMGWNFLIPGLSRDEDAACEDSEELWFQRYLRQLGKRKSIRVEDRSCSSFRTPKKSVQPDSKPVQESQVLIALDLWLVEDRMLPAFPELFARSKKEGLLMVYFGIGEGLGSSIHGALGRFPRRFPSSRKGSSRTREWSEVWLPAWNVIPFDAFDTVNDLVDYLEYTQQTESEWNWHWRGLDYDQTQMELQRWAAEKKSIAIDAQGSESWLCRACRFYIENWFQTDD